VRHVPVVTIDFGDGRKLKRTLTGNSAHHALLADGTPVDVLPGLYGPGAFLNWLKRVEQLTGELRQSPPAARADVLTQYHTERESVILERWRRELNEIAPPASSATQQVADPKAAKAPTAEEAGAMASTKGRVELPVLASIAPTSSTPAELESAMSEETWRQLARKYYAYAALDDASVALVAQQNPAAEEAMPVAVTKTVVESPLLRLVRNLQTSIALDTVRNEYLLHRQIHHWFAEEGLPKDVDALNERVYADLFLTPSSDPWLGLAPRDVYTALPENGIVETASTGTQ